MANEKAARRYATAIFALAREAQLETRVGEELKSVSDAIDGDAALRDFFVSPVLSRTIKERALSATFGTKVHEIVAHSVVLLVRKRRETLLGEIVRQYHAIERAARGGEPLTVTTARPLSPGDLDALVAQLERRFGKKFDVETTVDPHAIGGVRVMMGDRLIDATVAGRLDDLARNLFAQRT